MRKIVVLAVLGVVLLTGCKAKHPTAPVEGLVTYKGKPVTRGKVVFFHKQLGLSGGSNIGPDGRYKLQAPVGTCQIAVQSREDAPSEVPNRPDAPINYLFLKSNIPDRYEDHMRSGLQFDVQNGNNTFDLQLK
jgi:hypothetical protein